MPRHIHKDPTEFFSVVGAPYIRERPGETLHFPMQGSGFGAAITLACTAVVSVVLSAGIGAAKLVEVA